MLGSSLEMVLQADLGLEDVSDDQYLRCWQKISLYPMLVRRYFNEDVDQKLMWHRDLEDALFEYVSTWLGGRYG